MIIKILNIAIAVLFLDAQIFAADGQRADANNDRRQREGVF